MPPRQPTTVKPRTRRTPPVRQALAEVAAELNAAGIATKPKRNGAFSPYPDLSMAIAMLQKRAENLRASGQPEGERVKLIDKWLESLVKINTEMQKLHKLEILAGRLTSHPES